jgi:hypothetical protein
MTDYICDVDGTQIKNKNTILNSIISIFTGGWRI